MNDRIYFCLLGGSLMVDLLRRDKHFHSRDVDNNGDEWKLFSAKKFISRVRNGPSICELNVKCFT